jgi:hypothetical protein
MVNPCAVKGISIFTGLAERFPQVEFAAIPTWGTTAADVAALEKLPNVTILPPVDNVHEFMSQTRIALVPSLWAEARSRIILEAMVRGIPVIASDVGGLTEAKLGVDYRTDLQQRRELWSVRRIWCVLGHGTRGEQPDRGGADAVGVDFRRLHQCP